MARWASHLVPDQTAFVEGYDERTYGDRMVFAKVDTNANTQVAAEQGIMSLPTIQVWKGGQLVKSLQGGKTKKALVKIIEEFVA